LQLLMPEHALTFYSRWYTAQGEGIHLYILHKPTGAENKAPATATDVDNKISHVESTKVAFASCRIATTRLSEKAILWYGRA
jgi:hypothetical protein